MSSGKRLSFLLMGVLVGSLALLAPKIHVDGQQKGSSAARAADSQEAAVVRLSADVARSRVDPAFERAALQNVALQSEMNWLFGGRTQRGWYLYVPLIASMIAADEEPSSGRFAVRLSRWQADNGLRATGVLDTATWSRMVEVFQSARIKDRTSRAADKLVTAPIADFYDQSRPEELRQVEPRTYQAYKRMIRAAAADPSLDLATTRTGELASDEKFFKIISAFRSPEYQDQLRHQSPHSGRAGLAINSPHFTGRVLDLYVGGEPVSTKDENRAIQIKTPAYRWLVKNAARFGFRPYFYEPWHWEHVSD